MTRDELRQKLEAVRDKLAEKYAYDIINDSDKDLSRHCYKAAYDTLLCPLLLDAYEALEYYQKEQCTWIDGSINIGPANKALARIEAFANGEK